MTSTAIGALPPTREEVREVLAPEKIPAGVCQGGADGALLDRATTESGGADELPIGVRFPMPGRDLVGAGGIREHHRLVPKLTETQKELCTQELAGESPDGCRTAPGVVCAVEVPAGRFFYHRAQLGAFQARSWHGI
jgi:hypothetical protein